MKVRLIVYRISIMEVDPGITYPHRRMDPWLTALEIACLLLIFLMFLAFPAASQAYTIEKAGEDVATGIELSPKSFALNVEAGQTFSRDLTITNATGEALSFEFHTEDYVGSHDPSQVVIFLGDEDSERGARRWIRPELDNIVLQNGERLNMKVTVRVPREAEPGGHYAAFISSATAGDTSPTRNINRSLFLFRVAGAMDEIGTLDFPEVPLISTSRPVKIGLVFNNLGNIHMEPAGRVVVTNFRGKTVAEIPIEKGWVVMPDASRRTQVDWDPGFQFGRFTARAEIEYGSEKRQLTLARSFWVFPWQVVVAILTVVGLAAYLVYSWIIRRKQKASSGQLPFR